MCVCVCVCVCVVRELYMHEAKQLLMPQPCAPSTPPNSLSLSRVSSLSPSSCPPPPYPGVLSLANLHPSDTVAARSYFDPVRVVMHELHVRAEQKERRKISRQKRTEEMFAALH